MSLLHPEHVQELLLGEQVVGQVQGRGVQLSVEGEAICQDQGAGQEQEQGVASWLHGGRSSTARQEQPLLTFLVLLLLATYFPTCRINSVQWKVYNLLNKLYTMHYYFKYYSVHCTL